MIHKIGMIFALALLTAASAAAQDELQITPQLDRLFPSTVVVHEIRVVAQTTDPLPENAADFEVLVNGAVKPGVVMGVRLVKDGKTHQTDHTVIFLRVPNQVLKEGSSVQVRTVAAPVRTSGSAKVPAQGPNFAMTLGPSVVPGEVLTSGPKRAVGQLTVAFDEMTLTPGWMGARTYLKTASVISSDAKDTKSNVNLALGLERSLLKRWYVPFHVETKLLGDQVLDNASWVSSAGVTTLVPWGWTRGLLRNWLLEAPISPDFGLDAQLERRLRQDAQSRKNFLDKDAFRLYAHSTWARIRLLKGSGAGEPVEMEVAGSGWYLPGQHTGGPTGKILVDRLEGLLEVSVLVPVSKITVSSMGLTTPTQGTKSVVRVKYSHGANEANGFRHSSSLSLGVEVTGAK
ncbi:MAG TPA: hypothetical protein VNH18_33140 [Bryobacteraceae bacterium]|nr:hypothetical protein [Bryobacteraceae bacterium]